MAAGDDFARILDDKVGAKPRQPVSPPLSRPPSIWRSDPSVIFRHFAVAVPRLPKGAWAIDGTGRVCAGAAQRLARADRPLSFDSRPDASIPYGSRPDGAAHRTRTVRVFSAAELSAVDRLRRLGATRLPIDCSDGDIRSAYRALARRYHPDAHPQATARDRANYARLFAEVSDAYRLLCGGV
jgi:hypothetical protein